MTPGDWALWQQWNAACHYLMLLHPWHGLQQSEFLLGNWESGLQPGWNEVQRDLLAEHRTVYINIGDGVGETTIVPPPESAGTIHDATRAPPPLQGSRLWSVVCELGEAVARRGLRSQTDLDRIKDAIERAARSLRNEEYMKSLWRDAMARMRAAMRGSGSRGFLTGDFHQPVFDLIKAYLACDVPGMVASEVLGRLLSTQCTIPILGSPGMMPPEARIAAIEHLADMVYGLISKRDTLDVPGYIEATYLASLYTRAASRMESWAQPSGKHTPKELDRFKKLCLNLDELFAHRIAPVFRLPALFSPCEILVSITRRSDALGANGCRNRRAVPAPSRHARLA